MKFSKQLLLFIFVIISSIFIIFTNYYLELKYEMTLSFARANLMKDLEVAANNLALNLSQSKNIYEDTVLDNVILQQKFSNITLNTKDGMVVLDKNILALNPLYKTSFLFFNHNNYVNNNSYKLSIPIPVASNGTTFGTVNAIINANYVSNTAFYESKTFLITILCLYVIFICASFFLLELLIKPLKKIVMSAKKISNNDFYIEDKLPLAKDLKEITESLNSVSKKIKELCLEYNELSSLIRKNTYGDLVTNLVNQRYFMMELEQILSSSEVGVGGAVIILECFIQEQDLNDEVLVYISSKLRTFNTESKHISLVSAFGNGKFGLIVKNIPFQDLHSSCANLLNMFSINALAQKELLLDVYIGAALYQQNSFAVDVMQNAENALTQARQNDSSSFHVYDTTANSMELNWDKWSSHIKNVLEEEEIVLHFQPVYFYEAGGTLLFHSEVFLRILGPDKELMFAGLVLPVILREHMGVKCDEVVIKNVLDRIIDSTDGFQRYGINLSYQSLISHKFLEWLDVTLKDFGGSASSSARRITFEFKESFVRENIFLVKKFIRIVSKYKIQVGIDHFGRGLSNFDYLENLDIDYIKIDGSYTKKIHMHLENQAIVKSFIEVAHSRDILAFATYVEIIEERDVLNKLGIDGLQGFLIGQPV